MIVGWPVNSKVDQETIKRRHQGAHPMPSQISAEPRTKPQSIVAAVVFFVALILAPPPVEANWSFAPSIGAGLTYDDNVLMNASPIPELSVDGWALDGEVRMSYETQLTRFSLTPRLLLNRYSDNSELDSENGFLNFDYLYTGQLSRFRFRGSYSDETVRTAERSNIDFDAADPADIPTDDSGRVFGIENRQRVFLAPEWSYQTSRKSTVRLGARYVDAAYDESLLNTLVDYTESQGQASFEFDFSERNTGALSGYYRQNEFEGTDGEQTGYGLRLDFNRSLSETTRFKIGVGVDSSEDADGVDQENPIGEISIVRDLQTSRLLAAYRRTVGGSGSANLLVRDSISLNLIRDLSEKISMGFGVRAYQTQALDSDDVNFDERDYVQIRALFTWNVSRAFSVDFDYRYTFLDREDFTSDAKSNRLDLWFRYHPNR
jgi:hypothetical protein